MPRQQAENELARMVACLRHESFYETGTWIDETLGVYVGWVARAGSFATPMPVLNESGDRALIFSGEEYPEPDTAALLKSRGHSFDEKGPDYLVHLSEEDTSF